MIIENTKSIHHRKETHPCTRTSPVAMTCLDDKEIPTKVTKKKGVRH